MNNSFFRRIVSLMLCMVLIFSGVKYSKIANADVAQAVNMLTNGDFSDGMTGWNTYFYNGNCVTSQVTDDFEFNLTVNYWDQWSYDGNTWYKIDWQAILIQNVYFEQGKTYTLQFDAYASEPRSIRAGVKDEEYKITARLTEERQTFKYTFTVNKSFTQELQFMLGYIEDGDYPVPEGKHDIYISKVFMVEGDGSNIINTPIITGVDDDGDYAKPVTPEIRYDYSYNVELQYKSLAGGDYRKIAYTEGEPISEDGYYILTITDASNSNISVKKYFKINSQKVDMTKDYYFIKSRSSGKVLETHGFKENGAIVQSTYAEKLSQLFSIEEVGNGNCYIKSLSSGKVLTVNYNSNDGDGIIQQTYTGSNYQRWYRLNATQGYVSLKNIGSGKVIDVPSASSAEGIQMTQYTNNGSNAQQWDIIKVDIDKIMNGEPIPDTSTEKKWKKNVVAYPKEGELVAAGPIYFKWYNNDNMGEVAGYEIKFDDESVVTVDAFDEEIMEYEWYNTNVSEHTVKLTAVLTNGTRIESNTITFYVSKKGIGWGSLYRTDEMNLSWYYQWSMEKSAGTTDDLQFVPMVWGNWGSEWLNNPDNSKYKTVLGFNEPDFNEQSALTVDEALVAWKDFSNTDLRIGSPCTAIGAYWSKDWFWKFMDGIEEDDELRLDFITIHCYMDDANVDNFLALIDNTWEKWGLPIWITEFGVAKWGEGNDIWNAYTDGANEKVYEFMEKVIPELDKRPYVERYAWFPFDPNDEYGGASGIFNYDTGELNELGELYKSLGNPKGYVPTDEKVEVPDVELNGYQINNTATGFRCVYSVEDEIDNQTVVERGMVYALAEYASDSDVVVGSDNYYVRHFAATDEGIASVSYSDSNTATSYVMTMRFAASTYEEFSEEWTVRAYAKLDDGTYVYSDCAHYTIYNVARALYDECIMTNFTAHSNLYNKILKVVNPNYKEVDYEWSNIIIGKENG